MKPLSLESLHHPIQPIGEDKWGVHRFKSNAIIDRLFKERKIDLNEIMLWDVPAEDKQQFAQLLGYSLSGYGELPYVDNEAYFTAENMLKNGIGQDEAKLKHYQDQLAEVKASLRKLVPTLFRIAEEDLID